ncbi:hypothetical protein ELI51_19810 [Rhizobium leguminosarum]|uniref:hypothetical protein n=1 Tax=Rhizobium leguminosarum TaxID=384 RepID=UPI0010324F04|nr:hypothetical protein [Rhizobium leguminosarum]TAU22553.1 hypothetical protein ELI50_19085 [Rhizobium leguminosarum]TAU42549.1 hypothetical protein ELI51_19810 [Rhizobium leguminosarum]
MFERVMFFATISILFALTIWWTAALVSNLLKADGTLIVVRNGLLALLAATLLISISIIIAPPLMLSDERWYTQPPWVEIFLFFSMSCGMLGSYFKVQIEERRAIIAAKALKGDVTYTPLKVDKWDLLYPFLVSVITFGAVLQATGKVALDLSQLIVAFQTGFFWQTVLPRANNTVSAQMQAGLGAADK